MKNLKLYFSPFFILRYSITKDLKYIINKYKIENSILDVGCGSKPYQFLFKKHTLYKGIDFKEYSKNTDFTKIHTPDYYFDDAYVDSLKLPFSDEYFHNSCSFQVLEHHKNPQVMINEMFRVTKNGGYIILAFPFLELIHEM